MVHLGTGDDVVFLGSHLSLGSAGSRTLMEALPGSFHIKGEDPGTDRLNWLVGEFVLEAISDAPGAEAARAYLAHLVFLHVLRYHLSGQDALDVGWLRAVFDARIGPALERIHGDPSHDWSLYELASSVGMSRTAFAVHFKAVAGVPPLTYLTEWRMRVAERRMRESHDKLAEIAQSVGYRSEAAFSTAFKRVIGHSPRRTATL